jgi:hypothetical protein
MFISSIQRMFAASEKRSLMVSPAGGLDAFFLRGYFFAAVRPDVTHLKSFVHNENVMRRRLTRRNASAAAAEVEWSARAPG